MLVQKTMSNMKKNINLFLIWKKALTGYPCKSSQFQLIWPWCEMAVQLLMDASVDSSHF